MKKLRLLLVEDRPDDAILVVKHLEHAGYQVEFERVETAVDLERALDQSGWDVVLSDYSLPQLTALDALEITKEKCEDLPFIVVSGTVGEDVAVEAMRKGAHDYILKGSLTRLCAAVEREVREAEVRRQQTHVAAALQESEARFGRVLENVPDVIYRVRLLPDLELEYISSAAERVCGRAPEELIGRGRELLDLVHPDDLPLVTESVHRNDFGSKRVRWIHKNGEVRWLDHRNTPVYGDNGEVVALEGAARDVTEERQLEAQLEVAQRMEAIGRLAGGVAHDFNNLLTIINTIVALLLEGASLAPEVADDIREIGDAGRAAAGLTSQLLAFSRRQIRRVELVDVNEVLHAVDRMLRRLIGEDIAFETVLAPDLSSVEADRAQIEQIIMNLAVNARDAMPRGGRITLETSPAQLDEDYARSHANVAPGDYVMLGVSDDGCGMDEQTRARIFEPFFTTKGKGRGTGLGLSTVYGIVKQNDGHIFVYSEVGKGTTFKVYLPVSKNANAVPASVRRPSTKRTGSETILLVEDSPKVRAVTARSLVRGGYKVLESKNERDAIRLARQYSGVIHMLITDIVMPEMSGKEVAAAVLVSRPDIRVLYISGYTDNSIVHHGVLERDVAFLAKPFTPDSLLGRVQEELERG